MVFKTVRAHDFAIRNHYISTVGNGNKVYVDLHIKGKDITGYYFYYQTGTPINLEGLQILIDSLENGPLLMAERNSDMNYH
ncbi:MAG: hypothetical protein ABIL86_02075 [candidate division WOR-3 bacterium]